ncbi:hypothetical protein LG651_05710 [Tamlana sp. 62-3]|uniref:Uncharacterized protein n=1 Tax=Neotamlana sargassicola TaxID=2883125 RepID=A0A9X1L6M7_9FLAO|nr:lipid-binding protein [Tamlana sargassicola]MCB4807739.1 hypothetical protein [Tamlana sargassicola]
MLVSSIVSCDQVESIPDENGIVVDEIDGGWWIIALDPDGTTPAYGGDYQKIDIYNTSENDNTFWLDDHGSWMELKAKATLDLEALTFSSDVNTPELYTDGTVTITNGVITKDSYTTATGTVVDAIMFEAEFSWDPGTVYIFKGHQSTAKVDDLYPTYYE